MKSLRFLVVSALFTMPFFVFSQTSTTTVEQTRIQGDPSETEMDRLNLLLKIPDVRSSAVGSLLDVKVSPQAPGPNETIHVSVESYLSDLNKATITWSLNGRIATQGIGKTSFSFQNGPSGKTTNLVVSILTNKNESVVREFSWTPVGITLFWEADTYTPPFYRGKPLLSPQASVKLIATPNSLDPQKTLSAGNLVYLWEKGGVAIQGSSGYGKNYLTLVGPKPYDDTSIKVRVSSIDDTIMSEASTYLPLTNPFILFYDKNPLLGVLYNHPLGTTLNLTKKEFSINAEPYFFSNEKGVAPSLKYTWSVNGKEVQNDGRNITLRNESSAKGSSQVSLAMRGLKQTFQTGSKSLRVNFTEATSSARPTF